MGYLRYGRLMETVFVVLCIVACETTGVKPAGQESQQTNGDDPSLRVNAASALFIRTPIQVNSAKPSSTFAVARQGFEHEILSQAYLQSRTCWIDKLSASPRDNTRQIAFHLWLTGLNHRSDCSDNPIELPAVGALVGSVKSDWAGASQLLIFTGVNDITGCGDSSTSDNCIQEAFSAQPWPFRLTRPNPHWRDGAVPEQEFAALSSYDWTILDEGVIVLGQMPSGLFNSGSTPWNGHYNRGLYKLRVSGHMSDGTQISFHIFVTHLATSNYSALSLAELKVAMAEIQQHTSPDELAPLFVGDFNGQFDDWRLGAWFGTQSTSACADGVGADQTHGSQDGTMNVFVGNTGPGSPFARMRGSLKFLRRSFDVKSGAIVDGAPPARAPGMTVAGICHALIGYSFGVVWNPNASSPNGRAPCNDTTDYCGTSCVDLSADHQNCGSCSYACWPAESCKLGNCCAAGTTLCDGICVDLASDRHDCGSCGHVCTEGCKKGLCESTHPCSGAACPCPGGLKKCDDGSCKNRCPMGR